MSPAPGGSGEAVESDMEQPHGAIPIPGVRSRTCIVPGCHNPAVGLQCAEHQAQQRPRAPIAPVDSLAYGPAIEPGHSGPQRAAQPLDLRPRLTVFRVTLPFAVLVSDNARSGAGWWTTEDYRKARDEVHMLAMHAAGDRSPMLGPVAVRALVYMPDTRERDVSNYIKCAHDGLAGVAYEKDRQIRDVHWTAAGIDGENPRAEITVAPMAA